MYDIRKIGKNGIDTKGEFDICLPPDFGAGEETNVKFSGRLTRALDSFVLDGEGECILETSCCRCLKTHETTAHFKVLENFVEQELVNEGLAADYDDIIFDDETINIFPAIEKNLLNNIPMKFTCSEDCAGLCPFCGINLNHSECNCADQPRSEFAELLPKLK